MGWSIGYDDNHQRDVGYGVPAYCDHPDCNEKIDRGIAHVCGGEIFGGEEGCGLHFCGKHLSGLDRYQRCECCAKSRKPFNPKQDHPEWMRHKLTHESWGVWRGKNPEQLAAIRKALGEER